MKEKNKNFSKVSVRYKKYNKQNKKQSKKKPRKKKLSKKPSKKKPIKKLSKKNPVKKKRIMYTNKLYRGGFIDKAVDTAVEFFVNLAVSEPLSQEELQAQQDKNDKERNKDKLTTGGLMLGSAAVGSVSTGPSCTQIINRHSDKIEKIRDEAGSSSAGAASAMRQIKNYQPTEPCDFRAFNKTKERILGEIKNSSRHEAAIRQQKQEQEKIFGESVKTSKKAQDTLSSIGGKTETRIDSMKEKIDYGDVDSIAEAWKVLRGNDTTTEDKNTLYYKLKNSHRNKNKIDLIINDFDSKLTGQKFQTWKAFGFTRDIKNSMKAELDKLKNLI